MNDRRVTRVEEVHARLRQQLSSGEYQVGDQLPNETRMCEQFGVSRATVREAYRALIDAGYLTRSHGKGTFVARLPNMHSLDLNLSYVKMIEHAGFSPSVQVLAETTRVADEHTCKLLQLEAGDEVVVVERVRYADDSPVVYSLDRIPAALIPTRGPDHLPESLFGFLQQIGHHARNGRARLRPVLATETEATHLAVPIGTPLLQFDEVDYDDHGTPVLASLEWHTSDVFDMWINRTGQPGQRVA